MWVVILEKFLELPILDAYEVKGDTHEYNDYIFHKKNKTCSYKYPCFTWTDYPIAGLQD